MLPTLQEAVLVFAALGLIACPDRVRDDTAAWMSCNNHGAVVWQVGRRLGLVLPWQRPQALTPPLYKGRGLVDDHWRDLTNLRSRAHPEPVPVPMRMPPN